MIADLYNPLYKLPDEKRLGLATIPELTWAIFPAKGPIPTALQSVHDQIFQDWLPSNQKYQLSVKCCIELYYDPSKYPKGSQDENYYAEIWLPVALK